MVVNGLALPDSLVDALRSGQLARSRGSWQLKADLDAYGNPLESELGEIYSSPEELKLETDKLSADFPSNEDYGESSTDFAGPGAIPDITEFSEIVCFAISADGSPFCLDFRESKARPSVIWWDDVYWRRIAPDVESFLALFDFNAA